MLSDLFKINTKINGKQRNFLRVISKITEIKSAMGVKTNSDDLALANEASQLLTANKE